MAPFDPPRLADFIAGFPRPWWIVGGWSIEAFTGAPREHEDVDVSILACDVPALREHVERTSGTCGATPAARCGRSTTGSPSRSTPRARSGSAAAPRIPWVIDLPITPDRDGLWTNKRMPDHVAPLEDVTWVADDGIRYLNPEIVLLYKAGSSADARTTATSTAAWPLLSAGRARWLRDSVARLYPDHAWLALLS